MTSNILIGLILLISASISHALTVISDIDDTIKITRVQRPQAVFNGIFSNRAFIGMPELIQELKSAKNQTSNQLFLLSGSPEFIDPSIQMLIEENRIDADKVVLLGSGKKKPLSLLELMIDVKDDVILIGDDQEHDPEYYENLKNIYPEHIKAIYIHQLNIKKLPAGQIGFLSAYEVALHEAEAGRLTYAQAENVRTAILEKLRSKDNDIFISRRISEDLIPDWQDCTEQSVKKTLSTTRALKNVDHKFLNFIEKIATSNCDD